LQKEAAYPTQADKKSFYIS